MPECGRGCNTSELLPAFVENLLSRAGIEEKRITAVIKRLCEYAEGEKKMLCEMGLEELRGFVRQLYSLENESYSADDSHQDIHITMLFYDYLVERGCVRANPVRELKEAAKQQLLGRLGASGIKREADNG